ncbi:TPA: hypothetical protein ACV5OD_000873 [Citrobacter freundii]|uniref:hypothetical protein n=1 Tax=Citrobacter freundii TaxID=546 RepID=UPI00159400F3|nr:hypothetical protein [Citrobacter freundii]HBH7006787.1 hypothetical protein [Citrobacter freundii]
MLLEVKFQSRLLHFQVSPRGGYSCYLLLGFAGMVQQLGLVLSVCALLAWPCSLRR